MERLKDLIFIDYMNLEEDDDEEGGGEGSFGRVRWGTINLPDQDLPRSIAFKELNEYKQEKLLREAAFQWVAHFTTSDLVPEVIGFAYQLVTGSSEVASLYLLMERIEGRNLWQVVGGENEDEDEDEDEDDEGEGELEEGSWNTDAKLLLLQEVAYFNSWSVAQGIEHNDLSPCNVMVRSLRSSSFFVLCSSSSLSCTCAPADHRHAVRLEMMGRLRSSTSARRTAARHRRPRTNLTPRTLPVCERVCPAFTTFRTT